jgi:hypothetical protein
MNFVHICEHAFLSEGGKVNLIGIFKTIKVNKFPGGIPKFNIVGEVEVSSQITGDFKLDATLVKPNNKVEKHIIPSISGKIPNLQKDKRINLNFNLEIVGYRFTVEGQYKFLFRFNGTNIGEIALNVVQSSTEKK